MSCLKLKPIHLIMTISSLSQILRSAFLAGVRIGWLKRMSVMSYFPPLSMERRWKMPTFSLDNEPEKVEILNSIFSSCQFHHYAVPLQRKTK